MKAFHQECHSATSVFTPAFGPVLYSLLNNTELTAYDHHQKGRAVVHVGPHGPDGLLPVEKALNLPDVPQIEPQFRKYGDDEIRRYDTDPEIPFRKGAIIPAVGQPNVLSQVDRDRRRSHKHQKRKADDAWVSTHLGGGLKLAMDVKRLDLVSRVSEIPAITEFLRNSIGSGEYPPMIRSFVNHLINNNNDDANDDDTGNDGIPVYWTPRQLVVDDFKLDMPRRQRLVYSLKQPRSFTLRCRELFIYIFCPQVADCTFNLSVGCQDSTKVADSKNDTNISVSSQHYSKFDAVIGILDERVLRARTWVQFNAYIRVWIDDVKKIRFDPVKRNPFLRTNRKGTHPSATIALPEEIVTSLPL
mmetsp:Transcript_17679/g.43085  ORF Transcript_17679/g.43085 Transcript_17679/m.43085 type:complete len:359 (-) Transcript_17679:99-1175(-)